MGGALWGTQRCRPSWKRPHRPPSSVVGALKYAFCRPPPAPNPHTHPETPRLPSPPGSPSESLSRGSLLRRDSVSPLREQAGWRRGAGARARRLPPPPPRPRPLPSDNAKAAAGTGWSAEAACPGRRSLPAGRRHAWGGRQGARSLHSPAPSEAGWGVGAEAGGLVAPLPLPPGALT